MWRSLILLLSVGCIPLVAVAELYRDDITYLPADEREAFTAAFAETPTTSEALGIAKVAIATPAVAIRQLELARGLLADTTRDPIAGLAKLGFSTPAVQTAVVRFVSDLPAGGRIREAQLQQFVMQLLDTEGFWDHLWHSAPALNDFTGLECAPGTIPSHLMGPEQHQYLMRIAHPNMEFSLWRVDPETARRYPVAVTADVSLSTYQWVDRFSQPFAQLDRARLVMTLANGQELACARVPSEVMRAHHEYRREIRIAEKQL